ncbi:collagen alpha-1(I) chain-like [Myiozetetes cayanensis]|uniref:collagen alpha-1(I) chain-like n=1 Tax=Myiozetetes cayanensis TaxID=478635 RepID=UPI00215DE80C|nr:collagen alpha-1(I) chain-like [Myiozetetes cayanensis]
MRPRCRQGSHRPPRPRQPPQPGQAQPTLHVPPVVARGPTPNTAARARRQPRGWERAPRGCTRTSEEVADTREVHSLGASGCPSPGVRVSAHGVAVPALQPWIPPGSTERVGRDARGHLREPVEAHHPSALSLAELTGGQKSTPHVMRSGYPPREALGGPGTDTWGTRMRLNSAPARGQQRRGALGNPSPWLSPGHRPSSQSADLSDVPNGPGSSPGERQESPPPCPPGARSGVPPLPAQTGNPIPAAAPSASRRRAVLGTPGIAEGWAAKRVPPVPPAVPVRATAEVRGRRQAGAGAVARRPGPHSPCPRRGPSPGPPLPRISSAPRRPPPPAAAAPAAGAGGGRRCPAGTDSCRCSRCRSRCALGYGSRSRCASRCGAAGGGRTHSAGQRRLHPAAVAATGVKFQPPSPDRRGGHRHRYRDPDSNWHQNTSRHPDTHRSGTGPPTRTGAETAPGAGRHRDTASSRSRSPTRFSTGSRRHSHRRRAPAETRTPPGTAPGPPAAPDPRYRHPHAGRPPGRRTGRWSRSPAGQTPRQRGSLPRQPRHSAGRTGTRTPPGKRSALPGALREQSPTGTPRPASEGSAAHMGTRRGWGGRQGRGHPGLGGTVRRPTHPEPPRATRVPGARVRPRRRRSPASPPARALRSGPPRRGRPPPGCLPLPSPCLPPPGPPLAPGTWGPSGESSRARASPYVTARGPPRPSRGSRVLLCERAKSRGRLRSAPLHTCSPGRSRSPGRAPGRASPPGPALMAAGLEGGRGDCAARGCRGPCHLPRPSSAAAPRPYATPRLERGQRLGRRLCRGCTPGPRWPVGSAPSPGTPRGFNLLPAARQPAPRGPAAGADGRACRHLRSRRLVCAHLLGLSSAGVTTPASSCGITC